VRQNLAALERYPRLKLGYEWSGVELELLAQDAPDVLEVLREYAAKGRLSFYNGTYAQPHLQILSAESNLRQFQFGQAVYRELGLTPVAVYAHQEASVHDQVPQLLRAFGIPFAAVPGFLTTLVWLEASELLLHGVRGPRFLEGNEFASWQGLDGSQVPLYLHQPIPREMTLKETLAREVVLGRLSAPPVLIDLPDMIAIDDAWMAERSAVAFTTLDQALTERLEKNPERPSARLFTNWSYLEGIRAEELSRCNWQAERGALRAEAITSLAYILTGRAPESTDPIWKTILKCQHHDVYCFSAPELRAKSIGWLQAATQEAKALSDGAAEAITALIQTDAQRGEPVVVFNTVPQTLTGLVELTTAIQNPVAIDYSGTMLPCDRQPVEEGHTQLSFLTENRGLGYSVYWIRDSKTIQPTGNSVDTLVEFENQFYQVAIRPDGTFSSLKVKPSNTELIDFAIGPGNRLSATESASISFHAESPEERLERYISDPPIRGPELAWKASESAQVRLTPLGMTFSVSGRMGDQTQAQLTIRLYHQSARIDLTWDFHFDQASLGTFFDDDSKLLLRWPLAFHSQISHDIPFGVIQEREDRPFFPTSWADLSDGEAGLAFFHQGTPTHWVTEGTLFNLIAWGEDTDAIHNGLGRYQWLKSFDQRLDGRHIIHQAVYPHAGDWRAADIPRAAREFGFPPVATLAKAHPGSLPPSLTVIQLTDPLMEATSVRTIEGQVACRVYAAYGREASAQAVTQGVQPAELRLISGDRISTLHPYQIGELRLNLEKPG
jgi:alpha-mannosidase